MIRLTIMKKKIGIETYLIRYEEVYIVTTEKLDGAPRLPKDTNSVANELKQVLHFVYKFHM